jgi:hypothetical protein
MNQVQVVRIKELDVLTLPFYDSVSANSVKTLVSGYITFPFTIERLRAQFALNCNRQLRLRFFISPDDSAPASLDQTGHNILEPLGQVDYIVGDAESIEIPYRIEVDEKGMYVKIVAENLDSYEHTIVGQIFIGRLEASEV